MRRITCIIVPFTLAATLLAQPRLTLDYSAIAKRLVQQLALKPGERVLSIAHPGVFEDLLPYIRYEVMRAGGVISASSTSFASRCRKRSTRRCCARALESRGRTTNRCFATWMRRS
jgi:hypothetical protein